VASSIRSARGILSKVMLVIQVHSRITCRLGFVWSSLGAFSRSTDLAATAAHELMTRTRPGERRARREWSVFVGRKRRKPFYFFEGKSSFIYNYVVWV